LAVGQLLAAARTWGRPYIAIVTADHGESLGESDRWFHGGTLSPELLAVPLVLTGTGVVSERIDGPVGHNSITATLLGAAGIHCAECDHLDLRSTKGSDVIEGGLPPNLLYRIASGRKLVLDRASGRRYLYDMLHDPEEAQDLTSVHRELAEALAAGLGRRLTRPSVPDLERIRSLGYF
jgi:hypothetical protein